MDKTLGLYTFVGELNSLDFLGLYELETIKHHWNIILTNLILVKPNPYF